MKKANQNYQAVAASLRHFESKFGIFATKSFHFA